MTKPGLAALLVLAAVSRALAQTGPWTDGELIVRSSDQNGLVLLRIAPESGDAEPLAHPIFWGGWAGSMVFDSYRNGLLANCSLPPDPTFSYKLWLIAHDGTATAIPGFAPGVTLRALCATGDGRVYFQPHNTGSTEIRWIDAGNAIHTLLDASGTAPFQAPQLEHMLYHAPTNSLIACSSAWWSGSQCVPGEGNVLRFPLSASGDRVAGATLCSGTATGQEHFTGFDFLPGGNILLTMGTSFLASNRMRSIDPVTLQVSNWADPQPSDLDGGVWSSRIGRAIGLVDGNPAELRTWQQGGNGAGTTIATDIPIAGSGGYSPIERIVEVDVNGTCNGFALPYGVGLAGVGGLVPTLRVAGCAEVGSSFTITIDNAIGGGVGVLVLGFSQSAIPLLGGTLHVYPVATSLLFVCGGQPGIGGAGNAGFPFLFTNPAALGVAFYAQAGVLDAAAAQGVALTNGLQIVIG